MLLIYGGKRTKWEFQGGHGHGQLRHWFHQEESPESAEGEAMLCGKRKLRGAHTFPMDSAHPQLHSIRAEPSAPWNKSALATRAWAKVRLCRSRLPEWGLWMEEGKSGHRNCLQLPPN